MSSNIRLKKLILSNYRNHKSLNLEINDDLVLICGRNGSGKTNVLESISLYDSPSGFRNATLNEIISSDLTSSIEKFGINGFFEIENNSLKIGIGLKKGITNFQKIMSTDGKRSNKIITDYPFNIFWFVPKMSFLFIANSEDRRRFIDSMISCNDNSYKNNLNKYEKYKRERLKILKRWGFKESKWLDLIENNLAEVGINICDARRNFIKQLNKNFSNLIDAYPNLQLTLGGQLDKLLNEKPALEVEQIFLTNLRDAREKDFHSGRTSFSANKTDLLVYEMYSKREAKSFSTGQQKIIVFSIFLSFLKFLEKKSSKNIIFLLDDVFSYLDKNFIFIILEKINDLGIQTWMTDINGDFISENKKFSNLIKKINIDDKRFKLTENKL